MDIANQFLFLLTPFIYWATISIIYNLSKVMVMRTRLHGKHPNKWLYYALGTIISIGAAVVTPVIKSTDPNTFDIGIFILIWLPLIYGLRKGFRIGMYEIEQWDKGVRRI